MDDEVQNSRNETAPPDKIADKGIFGEDDIVIPSPNDYDEESPVDERGVRKLTAFQRFSRFVSDDIVGGFILIIAAVLALFFANGPFREGYHALATTVLDPGFQEATAQGAKSFLQSIHLSLTVEEWARDGILAIFFFTVGLELKEEFTHGSLRDPRTAGMPIIAAVFGMAGPAAVYLAVTGLAGVEAWHGWAIPTATDIAFAVAILQIFGRGLPSGARTFLLTLAVADDLGGIIVIALFYGSQPNLLLMIPVALGAALFSFLCRKRWVKWWLLIPIGVVVWYFMHASGIHATIAGVVLGMVVPSDKREGEVHNLVEHLSMKVSPISAAFAVPIFAFFAAGVNIVDTPGGVIKMLTNPVALAVMLALPLGKLLGISGSVFVMEKFTPLHLEKGVKLGDVIPISFVAGIGFTVALLISHLAFQGNDVLTQAGSIGVVMGTLLSIILGALALKARTSYRKSHDSMQ
ncbi:MAG: Na+/H+ antiporter NhaA [Mobiluncus porci]|uniref:Na+/H+ antiporter NhaA n=1 Tax=Mobiluncus porci TaxID=2652278 RepID=UPI0023F2F64B|nr:Na+/H+ antiporter NhaA [Mobiluncus porci]MDD7542125.1 Na+/H+ antiporter NhaA [Mobiluncus porci]MDY5748985.1 Na+/H+ antiporter NhaA [Mobiluncus porci]